MVATTADKITKKLKAIGNKTAAEHAQRFFKTGPGQYGEGDFFLGITVPVLRKLAKEFSNGKTISPTPASRLRRASARQVGHPSGGGDSLQSPPLEGCRNGGAGLIGISLAEAVQLLQSPLHEVRLLALLIMDLQYERGENRAAIYRAYLANTHQINNWDLVDLSASQVVGAHLFERNRRPLYRLAKSKSLWERRIAIIATLYFIRRNQFDDTLALADLLMNDKEDLMHKAVGWMLREIGKRDQRVEEAFLLPRYKQMPRTMLRYAIEKFPEPKRISYLKGQL